MVWLRYIVRYILVISLLNSEVQYTCLANTEAVGMADARTAAALAVKGRGGLIHGGWADSGAAARAAGMVAADGRDGCSSRGISST